MDDVEGCGESVVKVLPLVELCQTNGVLEDGTTFAVIVTLPPVWHINKLDGDEVEIGFVVIVNGVLTLGQLLIASTSSK